MNQWGTIDAMLLGVPEAERPKAIAEIAAAAARIVSRFQQGAASLRGRRDARVPQRKRG